MNVRSNTRLGYALLVFLSGVMIAGVVASHAQNPTPSPAVVASPSVSPSPSPTPTPVNWSTDPLLRNFVWRGIGPASMGGRIDDIAVVEQSFNLLRWLATNGVWKTTNNGTTFSQSSIPTRALNR